MVKRDWSSFARGDCDELTGLGFARSLALLVWLLSSSVL
jgi:hypothetical protein